MQDEQLDESSNPVSEQGAKPTVEINISSKNTGASLREDYGSEFKAHLLEQYKLYVEMADR